MTIASYIVKPKKVRFETQGQTERIFLLLRKHPITQVTWIFFAVFLSLAPLFLIPLLMELKFSADFITGNLIIFAIFFWYTAVFGYSFMRFLLWFFNVNIVTNHRIVDIDFPYLLHKESTATRISQIEDITHKRIGFIRTTFNFGDVYVQTAGAEPNIEFLDIPRPSDVVAQIVNMWQRKSPQKARAFLSNYGPK